MRRVTVALVCLLASGVTYAQVPVDVILGVGDMPVGAPDAVTAVNFPTVNGIGQVGFTGNTETTSFVWIDDKIVWLNSDADPETLIGAEATCGIGDGGEFVYSPEVDGADSVWTELGLLLSEEDATPPGFDPPTVATFNSRPHMTASGGAIWVAGYNLTGAATTEGRMLLYSPDRTLANAQLLWRSGDSIAGLAISAGSSGIDFDFRMSADATQLIMVLDFDVPTNEDLAVVANGLIVARESKATGDGDNWSNFDGMMINNAGDYLFSGDTDGATGSDEFIAYNGAISVREGDTIDSVVLGTTVTGIGLNEQGEAAYSWTTAGGDAIFATCDAADLAGATAVLVVGDEVDVDGDGVADGTVTDVGASLSTGPGLMMSNLGQIFVQADIDYGGGAVESIIAVEFPCCGNGVTQAGESCDDGNNIDGDGCSADCSSDETCGNGVVDPGEICDDGNIDVADGCSADCLSLETCGNNVHDTGEVCDDGNTVDGDGCSADCASNEHCGNGIVDSGEACDDGNIENGDGCSAGCSSDEMCGNGVLDVAEVCDDGNTTDGDGCAANCLSLEGCGNGVLDIAEECDDGNTDDDDGCSSQCEFEDSGDGGCGCRTGAPGGIPGMLLLIGFIFLAVGTRRPRTSRKKSVGRGPRGISN